MHAFFKKTSIAANKKNITSMSAHPTTQTNTYFFWTEPENGTHAGTPLTNANANEMKTNNEHRENVSEMYKFLFEAPLPPIHDTTNSYIESAILLLSGHMEQVL